MIKNQSLARSSMRIVMLLMTILAIGVGSSPAYAHSRQTVSQNLVAAGAPAKINVNDVLLNARAAYSVRTKETVRLRDESNPVGFNYEGIFIFGIPAVKIVEKIGFGDDTEGMDTGYSTYVGLIDSEWYGIEKDVEIVGKSGENRDAADRIFAAAGAYPFDAPAGSNAAKLSKENQTVDDVKCDLYSWKSGKNEFSLCVIRDSMLPVELNATLATLKVDIHYSNFGDPENVFEIPRKNKDDYFVSDAFMGLLSLPNFEYKTVYATTTAKGDQIESTIQGRFIQPDAAWEASEWAKTDDTSGAATARYVQIGRLRWTAPGDETKPFKVAPVLNPRGTIIFSDKFTRATPFLTWMFMVSDAKFKGAGEVVDDAADFNGQDAIKYKFTAAKNPKPDDFVEMLVLTKTGVPVHVDYHFVDGGRKNVVTWDITSMEKTSEKIDVPATK